FELLSYEIVEFLAFELTLINIRGSDVRIGILRVRRQLVSCGFHGCRVKEASDSRFDGSIESGMSSTIDLHM
ncbi:hypothetical protein H5410_021651, partial [Solanum commersonii]